MIFFDCFFQRAWLFEVNIDKTLEITIYRISNHSHIFNSSTALELFFKFFLSDIIGKPLNKKGFTSNWNSGLSFDSFSFCGFDFEISCPQILTIFTQSTIVGFFIVEFYMSVAPAAICILIPGHFDTNDSLFRTQELFQVLFGGLVR